MGVVVDIHTAMLDDVGGKARPADDVVAVLVLQKITIRSAKQREDEQHQRRQGRRRADTREAMSPTAVHFVPALFLRRNLYKLRAANQHTHV